MQLILTRTKKNTMYSKLILGISFFTFISCGGKETTSDATTKGTDSTTSTAIVEEDNFIDPSNFDFSTPVDAEKMYNSLMFFYDNEIQFLVYPYNNKILAYTTQSYSGPNNEDLSLHFTLKGGVDKDLPANTPVVVKGKISSTNYNCVIITDAVVVSEGIADPVATFDINKHLETNIYNPRHIYNFITQWDNKEVTISGLYEGYTHSGSENIGFENRVDVGPDFNKVIGCNFVEDPQVGDKLSSGVDAVTIKGTFSHVLKYGKPYIENSILIK